MIGKFHNEHNQYRTVKASRIRPGSRVKFYNNMNLPRMTVKKHCVRINEFKSAISNYVYLIEGVPYHPSIGIKNW